jgi:hypothetical protein
VLVEKVFPRQVTVLEAEKVIGSLPDAR